MIQIIGGLLIIFTSALFLWAYTYEPPYNMFHIIAFSATLIIGMAQTIVGIVEGNK